MKFLFALSIGRVHTRSLEWRRGVALLGHLRHSQRVKPLFRLYAPCTNEYAQHSFQKGMYRGWDFPFVGCNTSNDNKMIMRARFHWRGRRRAWNFQDRNFDEISFAISRISSFLSPLFSRINETDSRQREVNVMKFFNDRNSRCWTFRRDELDLRSFPLLLRN